MRDCICTYVYVYVCVFNFSCDFVHLCGYCYSFGHVESPLMIINHQRMSNSLQKRQQHKSYRKSRYKTIVGKTAQPFCWLNIFLRKLL